MTNCHEDHVDGCLACTPCKDVRQKLEDDRDASLAATRKMEAHLRSAEFEIRSYLASLSGCIQRDVLAPRENNVSCGRCRYCRFKSLLNQWADVQEIATTEEVTLRVVVETGGMKFQDSSVILKKYLEVSSQDIESHVLDRVTRVAKRVVEKMRVP